MKRKIIKINEEKCTGCGLCVNGCPSPPQKNASGCWDVPTSSGFKESRGCPEGALQIIDGKARLVGELLCDGLGACIGACPEGAITVEAREAVPYDEREVMANIVQQGENVLLAHLRHLQDHGQFPYLKAAMEYLTEHKITPPKDFSPDSSKSDHSGCPGMAMRDFRKKPSEGAAPTAPPTAERNSELQQWPIQLQLVNPSAAYFQDADLVIAADCVPFAFANFHSRFLRGKALIIFCPKLDQAQELYVDKLAAILSGNNIRSVTIIHMEVPCCFGTGALVAQALKKSGKTHILKDYTIALDGRSI